MKETNNTEHEVTKAELYHDGSGGSTGGYGEIEVGGVEMKHEQRTAARKEREEEILEVIDELEREVISFRIAEEAMGYKKALSDLRHEIIYSE